MDRKTCKTHMVLMSLCDGPATTAELSEAMGMDRQFVRATLCNFLRSQRVTRSVFHTRRRGPNPYLYQISGLGLRRIAA